MKNIFILFLFSFLVSCGEKPADLFKSQQVDSYDFPIYATVGDGTGRIWKIERDGSKSILISGLNDPMGLATDGMGHLYVVEQGASRLLKINLQTLSQQVVLTGLSQPSTVMLDSFGQVYVNEEGLNQITKVSNQSAFATFSSAPTAFIFGVNGQPVFGFFNTNQVTVGLNENPSYAINKPISMASDLLGRIYISEGTDSQSRILRIGPQYGASAEVIVNGLTGALGVVVDQSGNLFIAESGESRIVYVTQDGELFRFTDLTAPLYLAMTKQ